MINTEKSAALRAEIEFSAFCGVISKRSSPTMFIIKSLKPQYNSLRIKKELYIKFHTHSYDHDNIVRRKRKNMFFIRNGT